MFAAEARFGSDGMSKLGLDCAGALFCVFFFAFEQNIAFFFNVAFILHLSLNTCVLEHFLAEVVCRGQPLTTLAGEGEGWGDGTSWFVYKGG